MIGLIFRKPKKSRWLIEHRVKSIQEIYQNKWVAVMHEDCEYSVMPSWWARCLTVNRFVKLISEGKLYVVRKNPYK